MVILGLNKISLINYIYYLLLGKTKSGIRCPQIKETKKYKFNNLDKSFVNKFSLTKKSEVRCRSMSNSSSSLTSSESGSKKSIAPVFV